MNPRRILPLLLLCSALFFQPAWAEIAVIVHPSNTVTLSPHTIARIFLGKQKTFSGEMKAIPLDQNINTQIYTDFSRVVLRRHPQQVKAYWAQQLFTGKGTPPRSVSSVEELKSLISQNPSFIGYIDAALVDDRVRVAYRFDPPPTL
ncbi:hypothetical protein R50073_29820 [Maricurvus nonylphenolicus]